MMTTRPRVAPEARILLDSSVLIPALGDRPGDPWTPDCIECLRLLVNNRCTVLIAAPTLAEVLRFGKGKSVPRVDGVEVVSFDAQAARILANDLDIDAIRSIRTEMEGPMDYYKYDALIVACAKRHGAHGFVGRDGRQKKLAEKVGLLFLSPQDVIRSLDPHPTLPGVGSSGPVRSDSSHLAPKPLCLSPCRCSTQP
jgi:predicted nucleic acid-binding protein